MLEYGRFDHGKMKPGLGDWKAKIKSGEIQAADPPPPLEEIHPSLHELCVAWGYAPAPAVQPRRRCRRRPRSRSSSRSSTRVTTSTTASARCSTSRCPPTSTR